MFSSRVGEEMRKQRAAARAARALRRAGQQYENVPTSTAQNEATSLARVIPVSSPKPGTSSSPPKTRSPAKSPQPGRSSPPSSPPPSPPMSPSTPPAGPSREPAHEGIVCYFFSFFLKIYMLVIIVDYDDDELPYMWDPHIRTDRTAKGIDVYTRPQILMNNDQFIARIMRTPIRTNDYFKFDSSLFTLKFEPKRDSAQLPKLTQSYDMFSEMIVTILNSIRNHFKKIGQEETNYQVYLTIVLNHPYTGSLNTVSINSCISAIK